MGLPAGTAGLKRQASIAMEFQVAPGRSEARRCDHDRLCEPDIRVSQALYEGQQTFAQNALLMPASAALSVVAGEDSSGQQPQPFAISARDSSHKHTCNVRCKALSLATVTTENLEAAEAGRGQASWIWRSRCATVVVTDRPGSVHVPVERPGPTAGGQRDRIGQDPGA